MPGAVVKAFASELAADRSPSRKVVVVLTTTEPGTILSILTETLLSGYAFSNMLMNCRQHPCRLNKVQVQSQRMVLVVVNILSVV